MRSLPFSAVTTISIVLIPSETITSPIPFILAFSSFASAFILILVTSLSKSNLYSNISLSNLGVIS